MRNSVGEVTQILDRLRQGNREAQSDLVPLVYTELHRIAMRYMSSERPNHTLQATALVDQAYMELVGREQHLEWQSRAHFIAVAAQVMRRILIDHARSHRALRHGGGHQAVSLDDNLAIDSTADPADLLALDAALTRLTGADSRQGQIVELRFFGGLTVEETAEVLGISAKTVQRDWRTARAWLRTQLGEENPNDSGALAED